MITPSRYHNNIGRIAECMESVFAENSITTSNVNDTAIQQKDQIYYRRQYFCVNCMI
jgi:hypothetical protein